jgi:hypothetical protein
MASACAQSFKGDRFPSWSRASTTPIRFSGAIGKGETAGAPRLLERAYARSLDDEAAAAAALRESIEGHPAWPWLSNIKGVGHLLSAYVRS